MVAIFVLSLFLLIIVVDLAVLKFQGKIHPAFMPSFALSEFFGFDVNDITAPGCVLLAEGHTWLKKNSVGLIEVGIDAFGAAALGKITINRIAAINKPIKKGDILFEGKYGNKIVKFLSPINGVVKTVNQNIVGNPILDPYKNWGIQIETENFNESSGQFVKGKKALDWMMNEFTKLKNFIDDQTSTAGLAGVTMYDGGAMSNDFASYLTEESINNFEKEFLSF